MATTSRWRAHADRVIRETLAALPADATLREKKAALKLAYPFGPRQYLPYRHWTKAVLHALGVDKVSTRSTAPLPFTPHGNVPKDYLPFLRAMAADPADEAPRLIFADYLAEQGDENEAKLRQPPRLNINRLSRRLGGRPPHLTRDAWRNLLIDHADGNAMLVRFPEIDRAIALEKTDWCLSLWRKPAKAPQPGETT